MEIERKFLIYRLPEQLEQYPCQRICQAYICTDPVIRVRQKDKDYILTIKGRGMMSREEVEMPLPGKSFESLYAKKEGIAISKTRYRIPEKHGYTIELDIFDDPYKGLLIAEVEFPNEKEALAFEPPAWFGREVTTDPRFFNAALSSCSPGEAESFMKDLREEFRV